MNALALALLLAATPAPTGGTPAQRQQLRQLAEQVPDCFRNASSTPVRLEVRGGAGNDRESRISREEFDAEYRDPEGRQPAAIIVHQAVFEPYHSAAVKDEIADGCGADAQIRRAMSPMSILVHEFAHHYHLGNRTNRAQIEQFLDIRFRRARTAALRDPEIRRLQRAMARLEATRPPRNPRETTEREAQYCGILKAIDAKYAEHGFPARSPGDGPYGASDREGGEYFAVAIETLLFQPDVFARIHSPEEQAWLAVNLADCLETFPNLPAAFRELIGRLRVGMSRPAGSSPAAPAGMARD